MVSRWVLRPDLDGPGIRGFKFRAGGHPVADTALLLPFSWPRLYRDHGVGRGKRQRVRYAGYRRGFIPRVAPGGSARAAAAADSEPKKD